MAGAGREGNSGPRSLAALLAPVTRPAYRKRSPAAARVMSDWVAIVGPALAARTEPRRLVAGVLTLACDGPTALELQHLAGKLVERINVQLGETQVRQLRFVRGLVARPAAGGGPRGRGAPVAVTGVPEGRLAEALGRLGGAIAQRDRDR